MWIAIILNFLFPAYEDFMPIEGILNVTVEKPLGCVQIEILKNGIDTGPEPRTFIFRIWCQVFKESEVVYKVIRMRYVNIKNTDSKLICFYYST